MESPPVAGDRAFVEGNQLGPVAGGDASECLDTRKVVIFIGVAGLELRGADLDHAHGCLLCGLFPVLGNRRWNRCFQLLFMMPPARMIPLARAA